MREGSTRRRARWWFLTGAPSSINELVRERFKLALATNTPADRAQGAEVISHSDRLALVDRGRIVGFYESDVPESRDALAAEAAHRALPRAGSKPCPP